MSNEAVARLLVVRHEKILCPLRDRAHPPSPAIFNGYSGKGCVPSLWVELSAGLDSALEPEHIISLLDASLTLAKGAVGSASRGLERLPFFFLQTTPPRPTGQYFPVPNIPLRHIPHVASDYFCTSQESHPWIYPRVTPALPPSPCAKSGLARAAVSRRMGMAEFFGYRMSHISNFYQYRQTSSFEIHEVRSLPVVSVTSRLDSHLTFLIKREASKLRPLSSHTAHPHRHSRTNRDRRHCVATAAWEVKSFGFVWLEVR